jgi:glycosyltransferase involved in cell wall biosynthesis
MMYEPTPELWEERFKSRPPRLLKTVEQMTLAYVDRSFTVTQQLKEAYVARGASPGKIDVILNAPVASFLDVKKNGSFPAPDREDFVLICHGAVEERYGHDTLLEGVALLGTQIPNLRVKILGRGTYVDQFLAKRKALGLNSRVDYLGYVPLAQMVEQLCGADVGIVAQKSSPYSNLVHTGKMYEYIALGKPVLASRLKAVEAYFDDEAIRYFEPGNSRSLADEILDLYLHPEKREQLARNAQRLYAQYRWDKQKSIYLSAYQHLLNGPRTM